MSSEPVYTKFGYGFIEVLSPSVEAKSPPNEAKPEVKHDEEDKKDNESALQTVYLKNGAVVSLQVMLMKEAGSLV